MPTTRRVFAVLTLLSASLLTPAALAQQATPAPKPATTQPTQAEKPALYDESAVATEQIAAALAKAKKENRRVLIQWGGNWCGWCIKLDEHIRSDRDLRRKLLYEYDVVHIDIGRFDKNIELASSLGADLKANGVPFLTVLDADGKPIANQETGALEAADDPDASHDSTKLMAFLTEHQAEYMSASAILDDALAQARDEDKLAFVHFGAPWCSWCHRLEAFLAREDVIEVLGDHFIDVKIDTDRTIGGGDMLSEMRKSQRGGIPWFAFLDPDGEIVTHSSERGQNIGYPAAPDEADVFLEMLGKTKRDITEAQLEFLKTELVNSLKPRADQ
ncbi:MAG: thioredoxin family protein [Planctomycetota bacterium]|nr:thioredoxin family protein [Planctomycetota bacterium]